jgi:HTH-type transcriptional regulator / antitoxin HigA
MVRSTDFLPDWVSAPGDTVADILEERDISTVEFARRIGQPSEYARDLIRGRVRITSETAHRLEAVLGASATFWITRETQYREDLSRLRREAPLEDEASWLSELPVRDMIRFGWIAPVRNLAEKVAECLRFFDVQDIRTWRNTYRDVMESAAFRTSPTFGSRQAAVATWLRRGEIEGESVACNPWDPKKFRAALTELRYLTRKKDPEIFIRELKRRCAECGVAVVIVRAPSGCRVSGATRFVSPTKALLLLSFRHLSDDHFWFTFFHEAGHLLLHSKKALFLEGISTISNKEETEANDFAACTLIPNEFQQEFLSLSADGREVMRFAKLAGVSPGIVVGQLQHLGKIRHNQLNNLRRRYTWGED